MGLFDTLLNLCASYYVHRRMRIAQERQRMAYLNSITPSDTYDRFLSINGRLIDLYKQKSILCQKELSLLNECAPIEEAYLSEFGDMPAIEDEIDQLNSEMEALEPTDDNQEQIMCLTKRLDELNVKKKAGNELENQYIAIQNEVNEIEAKINELDQKIMPLELDRDDLAFDLDINRDINQEPYLDQYSDWDPDLYF